MRKYAYLARLEELLAALPAQDRQEALNYYEEYFDAAGSEKEEQTAEELGDPAQVARKILEGEGIDPETTGQTEAPQEAASPAESPKAEDTSREAAADTSLPITPPESPEPPPLDKPLEYPATGTGSAQAKPKRNTRRIWLIFWLLVALALVVQVSVLLLGLAKPGASTASMVASSMPVYEEAAAESETADNLEAAGPVTYRGTLEVPGKGTLFVNLTRGNVAFRTGEQASVEVRNVDVTNNVSYGQTVDHGYTFVCDSTDPNTHVTITLPADAYDRIEIHIGTSGSIELGDLQTREITAYTASGPIQSGCICVEKLQVQTDIGSVWLEKVSDGTTYTVEEVSIQAPGGYVGGRFSASRSQWETNIVAPKGLSETSEGDSGDDSATRTLQIQAAGMVTLKYGVD